MNRYKKIGEFIEKQNSNPVNDYEKFSILEANWNKLIGPPLSDRTAPVSCDFSEEGMKITINVEDHGLLQAINFRRHVFLKVLKKYFSREDISVEIKAGKIVRQGKAKGPKPDHMRRAPVFYSEEDLKNETEYLMNENELEFEIAEPLAKLKLTVEKLKKRNN